MTTLKQLTGEEKRLLQSLPLKTLKGLQQIITNPELHLALRSLLATSLSVDQQTIIKHSGAVSSLDTLINFSNDASFYRGRIAIPVVYRRLLETIPAYLDKLEENKEAKESQASIPSRKGTS